MATTSSGLIELMQKFPHLFGSYAQSYKGPTREALQRMDPTYGNWTGGGATHSLPQYNALKEQWQQQQADRMTQLEDYYGFSPTDEQRQSLVANVGPQLEKQYYTMPGSSRPWWFENKGNKGPGQEMQHELDTAAAHATYSLDKWLPGQEGLFDALYNYEPPLRNEQIRNEQTDSGQDIEGFIRSDIGNGSINGVSNNDIFTRSKKFTGPRTLEEIRDYATQGGYSQMEEILNGTENT